MLPLARASRWGGVIYLSECGGGIILFLFFTPPPKYFGASDTCHRPPFPVTMCKEKI